MVNNNYIQWLQDIITVDTHFMTDRVRASSQSTMREIVFVTGNANKLREVQALLRDAPGAAETEHSVNLVNRDLDLLEVQDLDLKRIALEKLKQATAALPNGTSVFVEDTALRFDAFNGLPGAYIKWFLKSMTLAQIVQLLDPYENKGAEAITTLAYADSQGNTHIFQGITKGKIVDSRGPTTFGWDSIFEPQDNNWGMTYAELSKDKKNEISHRAKAFAEFKKFLRA